jgi:hypothetical protein
MKNERRMNIPRPAHLAGEWIIATRFPSSWPRAGEPKLHRVAMAAGCLVAAA